MQSLKAALRSLQRSIAFTAVVIITIATGIGIGTAVFSIVHGIAFPRLPYRAPDRVAVLGATIDRQIGVATEWLTPEQLRRWEDNPPRTFAAAARFAYQEVVLEQPAGGTVRVQGAVVDGAFFPTLGVPPRAGRAIAPSDEQGEPVVVLGDAFWRSHFGSDPDVLHRALRLGRTVYTVIGVMPPGFDFPARARFWTSAATPSATAAPGAFLLGRLPDGVPFAAAAAEIAAWYEAAWQADSARFRGMGVALTPFGERERRIPAGTLVVVAAGVAIVFLIALVNLSVLLLARSARRARELAIRSALGATPLRAVRPLVAELLVLAATGALLGVGVAAAAIRIARGYVPEYAESATTWSDPRVLGFAVALTLVTTMLLALQPALRLRHTDVIAGLRRGDAVATATTRERRLRNALVVAQVALALVLVGAAGIVAKSLANFRALDVGYDVERMVVARPDYDFDAWDDARQRQLGEAFLARFGVRADVASAAIWRLRMAAWPPPPQHELFGIEGREQDTVPSAFALGSYYEVSPAFFRALGVDISAGRDFQATDGPGAEPVAILMESASRVWFGGEPALGRRVRIGPPGSEWLTVVGIVPDFSSLSGLGREIATRRRSAYLPWLFRPLAQARDTPPVNWPRRRCLDCATVFMAVRLPDGGADERGIARAIAAELRTLAPDLPVEPMPFLEQQVNWYSGAILRRNARALIGFATLALALALLGLHGIVADAVNRRTAEIGIRIALGARAHDVIRIVARESVFTAAAGVALGVLVVVTATGITKQLFFAGGRAATLVGTSAADPFVLIPAAATMLLVAAVTAIAGARRAAQLDPNVALRAE